MQFDYMNEFIVFAHHLNMTNAAAELHMAQSTLSKHIKQLETTVGCPLISFRNGKTYLTKAGAHFLNCSTHILTSFNQLVDECQDISDVDILPEITVQTPALTDRASEAYYRFIRSIRRSNPDLQVRYLRATYKSIREGLRQGACRPCHRLPILPRECKPVISPQTTWSYGAEEATGCITEGFK